MWTARASTLFLQLSGDYSLLSLPYIFTTLYPSNTLFLHIFQQCRRVMLRGHPFVAPHHATRKIRYVHTPPERQKPYSHTPLQAQGAAAVNQSKPNFGFSVCTDNKTTHTIYLPSPLSPSPVYGNHSVISSSFPWPEQTVNKYAIIPQSQTEENPKRKKCPPKNLCTYLI